MRKAGCDSFLLSSVNRRKYQKKAQNRCCMDFTLGDWLICTGVEYPQACGDALFRAPRGEVYCSRPSEIFLLYAMEAFG